MTFVNVSASTYAGSNPAGLYLLFKQGVAMTVREMIAKLQQLEPDADLCYSNSDCLADGESIHQVTFIPVGSPEIAFYMCLH